jgi:type IV pilus assembly protein PilF
MRHESIATVLALALLAGCSHQAEIIEVPTTPGPQANIKNLPGDMTNGGAINLGLAQGYLKSGQLEMALDRANRALASDPGSGNAHAMLGLIQDRIGNQERAGESFRRAIQLAPNSGSVLNAYGSWLCSHGDPAGAAQMFGRAIADPFFTSPGLAHFNAGECLLRSGKAAAAEASMRRALEAPGADLDSVLMGLAQASLAQGKLLEARGFIQRRESMGATTDVLELAARIEEAAGDTAAAARYRVRLQAAESRPANREGQR